jgi:AraC-like DNA-binding protein
LSPTADGFDVRSVAVTFRHRAVIRRHAHPWGQLVFATRGVMRVTTDKAAWLVPATRAIWLPAGLSHEIAMRGEVAMRTLYLAPTRAALLSSDAAALEVSPLLRELILHVLQLGMLAPSRPEHDRLAGLLSDLIATAPPEPLFLPLPRDPRARTLAESVQADPDRDDDLARLAREAGASLRTLQRVFPRETGLTLEAWRQRARLVHAAARLSAGATVTHAALDCGYQSVGAFIAAFRRQFGVTPGRYGAAAAA